MNPQAIPWIVEALFVVGAVLLATKSGMIAREDQKGFFAGVIFTLVAVILWAAALR